MKSTFSAWRYLWKSEDIRRKLLITLGLLVIYRLAANVPVPGINTAALANMRANLGASGTFFDFLDLLSGGTVSSFSLLSMGVYPYITAQIILQLLVPIIPALQRRMEDDPREGKKWMEKWTYYLAVPMAALSAFGQINIFNNISVRAGSGPILDFGFSANLLLPSMAMLLSMIAGTMFAIWLGELISEFGVRGQGLSLIIFAGIVSKMPSNFRSILADEQNRVFMIIFTIILIILTIFAIVYVQQGRRNVPVMYPGRRMGNRMSMPVKGSLPLMVNMSGMIPLIFASAFLQFPAIIASYFANSSVEWIKNLSASTTQIFGGGSWVYWLLYFLMVVGFTFFYTDVLFAQQNYGDNLKKMGAQIPGVNRGTPTQKYLTKVQRRVTLPGALFLGIIAILPFLVQLVLPIASQTSGLFLVSSAGLLIVVGVVRDLFLNIDAELQLHGYDDSLLVR
ncbi:MAG TPA: preprotein translocase subunit SecY [Anaerolineales bacterium]|nr:preprotein translocase subunit SecY [Anaerolineales bacterium]